MLKHMPNANPRSKTTQSFQEATINRQVDRRRWSGRWESNPRPRNYRSCALPTELSLDTAVQTGAGCRSRTSRRSSLVRQALPSLGRRWEGHRCPQIKPVAGFVIRSLAHQGEAAWKHADDGVIAIIEPDKSSHNVGSTSKKALPDGVTQNNYLIGTWVVLLGKKVTADCHVNFQQ